MVAEFQLQMVAENLVRFFNKGYWYHDIKLTSTSYKIRITFYHEINSYISSSSSLRFLSTPTVMFSRFSSGGIL